MRVIRFDGPRQAALVDEPRDDTPLAPEEVTARTLVSLISPGTEINSQYLGETFPAYPGYAAVMRVEQLGEAVDDLHVGPARAPTNSRPPIHRLSRRPHRHTMRFLPERWPSG
ncbi:MAG: hypothetical protein GVY24_02630 [Planctomycetes bacterium]|nr:hypothetical protein [Planctomycetota bacterium]